MSTLNATLAAVVQNGSNFTFGVVDYIVFVLMLSISLGIGIYFGFFGHGADNTEEYLLGGKRMKTIPIAISLIASQLSAISIMTVPGEMYTFGVNWFFNVLSMVIVTPILCWVVVPVFYNNNISNCYEYLERRFNRATRELLAICFMGTLFLMLPVFIFIPALAFAQVSNFNIHLINTIICSICVLYTMLGGIKAVVWTDVVQAAIMVGAVTAVGILGAQRVGGFGEVVRVAAEGGRLSVNFTFDATTRSTFWNCFITAVIVWTAYVGLNQSCVQRIVALPSLSHARRSLLIFAGGFLIIMFFNCYTGITMYAYYHKCDPLAAGLVQKPDKMMPYFVQDIMGHIKGMPGVFISCVFSAALSTMSAGLNSLAGVVYCDYIRPHIKHTERRANFIMRAFICLCGVYSILGGLIVEKFSSILQVVYMIGGVSIGSVFSVFLLGMLMPRAHGRAAFWSVVASMSIMLIIVLGAQGRIHYQTLPTTVEGCSTLNVTSHLLHIPAITAATEGADTGFNILDLSFNWYALLGASIVFIFAIPLSYFLPSDRPHKKCDPKLLSPVVRPFVRYELAHTEEMNDVKIKKEQQ